jgi:imidazolonepropionase
VNGAYALARGHRCGSLEPGKAADLLMLNVTDYREVAEQIGVNHVHMVLKNGKVIYHEGEVTGWTSQ